MQVVPAFICVGEGMLLFMHPGIVGYGWAYVAGILA